MALVATLAAMPDANAQAKALQNDQLGFVVTKIAFALSRDASETGGCPDGMTSGYRTAGDVFVNGPAAPPFAESAEPATLERALTHARITDAQNYCQNPELGVPDANFHVVTGANVPALGIDLDGQESRAKWRPAPGTCAHDDFPGLNGEHGIDNQFFRVVGCSKSFQSTGLSNTFESEMLTGAWGILITLSGVDDLLNDDDVEVGFYANADPIQLSPAREPLPYVTYAIDQDPRFHATSHGRIVNGVLTTDPVDVRFHSTVNGMHGERRLQDARVRLSITADRELNGILAGYTSVEDMYDFGFGFRRQTDGVGRPASHRLQSISSIGYAITQGHTCQGVYYALKKYADGHRDPATGQCQAISTQYRIRAIPAFVVNKVTRSVNSALDK